MPDTSFDSGFAAYDRRDWSAAITALRSALTAGPQGGVSEEVLHAAWLRLASAQLECGLLIDTLESLKSLLEIAPDHIAAWNNLGIVCGRLNRMEEARRAFEVAHGLDPSDASILTSLGSSELKCSDPGGALGHLVRAIELDPTIYAAHVNLSLTLLVFGRIEEAEESLRLAVFRGFEDSASIEDVIAKMKEIRAVHLEGSPADAPPPQEPTRGLSNGDAPEVESAPG
jgi:tetratricopeptide (TPR) repeat protein